MKTPDTMTLPADVNIGRGATAQELIDASQAQNTTITCTPPFDKIKHLLSGKPLHRPVRHGLRQR